MGENEQAVIVGAIAFFGIMMLGLWAVSSFFGPTAPPPRPGDLRATALLGLTPSGTWQQLDDEVVERARVAFAEVLSRVAADGFPFDAPIVEDWGLSSRAPHWELSLGSLDDESGWSLQVRRAGGRPIQDDEPTRRLLGLLDTHLGAVPAFGTVRWVS